MKLHDIKQCPPMVGSTILAFSPVYQVGHPMRWRFLQVLPVELVGVTSYISMDDLETHADHIAPAVVCR